MERLGGWLWISDGKACRLATDLRWKSYNYSLELDYSLLSFPTNALTSSQQETLPHNKGIGLPHYGLLFDKKIRSTYNGRIK